MIILRNGKKFNVTSDDSKSRRVLLENVCIETARSYIAKNGNDKEFSNNYKKGYFDSGVLNIFGENAEVSFWGCLK